MSNNYQKNKSVIDDEKKLDDDIIKNLVGTKETESKFKSNNYLGNNDGEGAEDLRAKVGEIYSWYLKFKKGKELIISEFEGEPINRTFKLYPKVQQEFKEFCEKHKDRYKVQDIISQALLEFMGKYK